MGIKLEESVLLAELFLTWGGKACISFTANVISSYKAYLAIIKNVQCKLNTVFPIHAIRNAYISDVTGSFNG